MKLSEIAGFLMISAVLTGSIAYSMATLINQAKADNLKNDIGALDMISVSTNPSTSVEVNNGANGGIFSVPPSNAFTEIKTWNSLEDVRDLYTFTLNGSSLTVATTAQGTPKYRVLQSGEDFTDLSNPLELIDINYGSEGIAPIFGSNTEKVKKEVLLSLFSLRDTCLERFVTNGKLVAETSLGDVNLDPTLTVDNLMLNIFGNANDKKVPATNETWGIMRLTDVGTEQINNEVSTGLSNKFKNYKVYTSQVADRSTVRSICTKLLLGTSKDYESLTDAEREVVNLLSDGITNYGTGDIIVLPVSDKYILDIKKKAILSSKQPIVR